MPCPSFLEDYHRKNGDPTSRVPESQKHGQMLNWVAWQTQGTSMAFSLGKDSEKIFRGFFANIT
jgi:hypothetical protein